MTEKYMQYAQEYVRVLANYTRELNPNFYRGPNIIMLHVGRSGSTVLGDLLGQRPEIMWDREVLLHHRIKHYARLIPFRKNIINNPVRTVHWRMLGSEKQRYGFETMPHQLERYGMGMPEYLQQLKTLNVQYALVLRRKNTLRLVISLLHAMRINKWHSFRGAKTERSPIHIQLDNVYGYGNSLIENLDYFANFHESINEMLGDYKTLNLSYEDDIAPSPLIGYEKCCEFLELPPFEGISVRLRKLNPYPLNEMVENYDDVEKELSGTQYEWMLFD